MSRAGPAGLAPHFTALRGRSQQPRGKPAAAFIRSSEEIQFSRSSIVFNK
jgi:hypothetical protein